jgi:D-glycero-alpha-D-manno-heptose-7-phosphate kinase
MLLARSPLRVSFLGGGSDYPEHYLKYSGAVLGIAITDSTYVSAIRIDPFLAGHNFKISYNRVEEVESVSQILHAPFRHALGKIELQAGWEFSVSANLPAHTGLGSSSSFLVSTITLANQIVGREASKESVVNLSNYIEREDLGQLSGLQDHLFATYGGGFLAEIKTDGSYELAPIREESLRILESSTYLFSTGTRRKADMHVAEIVKGASENKNEMSELAEMARYGYQILQRPNLDLEEFGSLVNEGWRRKKLLSPLTSSDQIEDMIGVLSKSGAVGSKLLGAGGGGFVAAIVPPERASRFESLTKSMNFRRVKVDRLGAEVKEM